MTSLKLLLSVLCLDMVTCYICNDINFETVNFHLCPERCMKCSLLYSCLECENKVSDSVCMSICRIDCDLLFIPNGTVLRGCYKEKEDNKCYMYCLPYRVCSNCSQIYEGVCSKCKSNSYGHVTHCDKQCGSCRPNKDEEVICDIATGHCKSDCLDGFYGEVCDKICSRFCFDAHSNSTKCDRLSGKCVFGCTVGKYSETCQNNCSKTCLNYNCDQSSGACNGCLQGWFGITCERKNSDTCNDTVCNQKLGTCSKGCKPGLYGKYCNIECSSTCMDSECHQISGHCKNGCLNGWFGVKCKEQCSSMCLNFTCKQTFQHCVSGCVPGRYGSMCNETCSEKCLRKTCEQSSGKCLFGCIAGWFGQFCNTSCSGTCVDKSCDQITGDCERGCIDGYYGDVCENNCSESRQGTACKNYTVPCLSCESAFANDTKETDENTKNILISIENTVIIGLLSRMTVILCALCILFVYRRNKKFSSSNEIVISKINANEESIYYEIKDFESLPLYLSRIDGEAQRNETPEISSSDMQSFDVSISSKPLNFENKCGPNNVVSDKQTETIDGKNETYSINTIRQSTNSSLIQNEYEHRLGLSLDTSTNHSEESDETTVSTDEDRESLIYLQPVN